MRMKNKIVIYTRNGGGGDDVLFIYFYSHVPWFLLESEPSPAPSLLYRRQTFEKRYIYKNR